MAVTPYIIPQQPVQLGPIGQHSDAELSRLMNQRRVFNRLDWWSPIEWRMSDAFCSIASGQSVDAAVLIVPTVYTDIRTLLSAQSSSAWLRWCAVADGVPASATLHRLFEYCEAQLWLAGIAETFCIVESTHWFHDYLRELGYSRSDDVVTMICRNVSRRLRPSIASVGVSIRPARESDLGEIIGVDMSAFVEHWQYPGFVLKQALRGSAYFSVALRERQVIGYLFATSYETDAHITRLAVRSDCQGQGVGAELLHDALVNLEQDVHAQVVTLNTQQSNQVSQRLYARFGFETMQPIMRVMHKRHQTVRNHN